MSLFGKKSSDRRHLFSFTPDYISQESLRSLANKTDLYSKTKRELIILEKVNYYIYQFDPTSLSADIIPCLDDAPYPGAMKVVAGEKQVGFVPKKKLKHVLFSIDGDCDIHIELSGGPYKIIDVEYDDYGHPRHWIDKHDDDVKVKVIIEY